MKQSKQSRRHDIIFGTLFVISVILLFLPVAYGQVLQHRTGRLVAQTQQRFNDENQDLFNRIKGFNQNIQATQQHLPLPHPELDTFEKVNQAAISHGTKLAEPIGYVSIPSIAVQNTVIRYDDTEAVLSKGAGTMPGTSVPFGGRNTLSVVTGHTGLANRVVFDNIRYLKNGDVFYLTMFGRKKIAYQVYQKKVIDPDLKAALKTVQVQEGKDIAVLLTCTPVVTHTHRLLVYGKRIPVKQAVATKSVQRDRLSWYHIWLGVMTTFIVLIAAIWLWQKWRARKTNESR